MPREIEAAAYNAARSQAPRLFTAPRSKRSSSPVFAVFAGPPSSLCLKKFLNVLFDCDCHNHIQGVTPVDVEEELHATSFAARYSVRTDIGHVNWRKTKVGTAKGFGSAP